MRSRILLNLLLIAGIVVLGLIARFEPGIEPPAETAAITAIAAGDVHRIHLNRPVRDDLVLVRRTAQEWEIERAEPLPADGFKVQALLRLAEQKPVRSYAAADMDLAQLQLDPPYASVILNDTAVEFGSLEPIDQLRYVRVNDHVFLIPDNYLPLVEAGFTQFVRPSLFAADARIEAIRVPGLAVERRQGEWKTDPGNDVSADALQQFVDIWRDAAAIGIQPADPAQAGDPVEVRLQGQETAEFQVIARHPELVLSRPAWGIQYRMGNRSEAMLTLDAATADAAD